MLWLISILWSDDMISCLSMKLWTHFAPPLFNGLPCVSQYNYHKFQLFSFNFQNNLDQSVINLSVVVVVMVALFRFATVFWLVTHYDLGYFKLDETAIFGCACRHEFPLFFINLKHGER